MQKGKLAKGSASIVLEDLDLRVSCDHHKHHHNSVITPFLCRPKEEETLPSSSNNGCWCCQKAYLPHSMLV
jgi:hypothetical protein